MQLLSVVNRRSTATLQGAKDSERRECYRHTWASIRWEDRCIYAEEREVMSDSSCVNRVLLSGSEVRLELELELEMKMEMCGLVVVEAQSLCVPSVNKGHQTSEAC